MGWGVSRNRAASREQGAANNRSALFRRVSPGDAGGVTGARAKETEETPQAVKSVAGACRGHVRGRVAASVTVMGACVSACNACADKELRHRSRWRVTSLSDVLFEMGKLL